MPLPVLPANNTARYKIFYTVGGHQHVQEVRVGVVSPSALGTALDAYYTAINDQLYTVTIDEVQYAGSGSDIFFAVSSGIEGNNYGGGTPAVAGENAYFLNFSGRTSGGRRMRFYQYGPKGLGGDYRFVAGENADLDAGVAAIVGTPNMWLGIDGVKPAMKSYINAGVNAYWQRNLRP